MGTGQTLDTNTILSTDYGVQDQYWAEPLGILVPSGERVSTSMPARWSTIPGIRHSIDMVTRGKTNGAGVRYNYGEKGGYYFFSFFCFLVCTAEYGVFFSQSRG